MQSLRGLAGTKVHSTSTRPVVSLIWVVMLPQDSTRVRLSKDQNCRGRRGEKGERQLKRQERAGKGRRDHPPATLQGKGAGDHRGQSSYVIRILYARGHFVVTPF